MSEAKAPAPVPAAPSGGGGGIKALLPLILTVVLMPVLAYVMTAFVLVPKLQQATVQARAGGEHGEHGEGENAEGEHGEEAAKDDGHGEKKDDGHGAKKDDGHGEKKDDGHGAKKDDGHGKSSGSGKPTVQFGKVLVNVAGSLGARYLLTNFTLVGANAGVVSKVESNKDQLMDMTISTLRTKTIQDLEKPGAANLIRTELISVFNGVLGPGSIKEIYFTEFAIQ
ncbi:MAG: flagellar basal body-associated FliL family protein [Verrucomicrobiales bacterium]|nr:flagellar basal body-associated FliL family protein [Verrucomicrobiales bacterium]